MQRIETVSIRHEGKGAEIKTKKKEKSKASPKSAPSKTPRMRHPKS